MGNTLHRHDDPVFCGGRSGLSDNRHHTRMARKIKKRLKKAYRKGRKEGFDHGFNTAKMIYNEIAVDLKRQIEQMNTEFIIGEEEDDDDID